MSLVTCAALGRGFVRWRWPAWRPQLRWALSEVSFTVAAGEVIGVYGPNGAGKSTLLRLLAGSLEPTLGALTVCGHDARRAGGKVRRRASLAGNTEGGFFLRLSGRENLRFFAGLYGLHGKAREQAIAAAMGRLGLEAVANEWVGTYSAGTRQRLALARALVPTPELLLLDEPTGALDHSGRERLWQLVGEQRARPKSAVVLATHDEESLLRCDRALLLADGRLVGGGSPRDVLSQAASLRRASDA